MNILKKIAASAVAVSFAGIASAAVNNPGSPYDLYFSGSTAYRTQVVAAEISVLSAGLTTANGFASGTVPGSGVVGSSALASSAISIIHGVDANNNEIVIHNHWTGSVAGLTDLCTVNTADTFIPDSQAPAINTTGVTGLTATQTTAPEVAMADCAASDGAIILSGANTAGKTASADITAAAPVNGGVTAGSYGFVGSVDFEWLLGSIATGAPTTSSPISNITQDNAEAILTEGYLPASFVTGNSADSTSALIFIGRNEDSGTRVAYQAESWANGTGSKYGLGATTTQWLVTQSGVSLPTNSGYSSLSGDSSGITAIQKWPRYNWNGSNYTTSSAGGWSLYTESGITWSALGHSGYNGGGDVAAILESPNPVTGLTGVPSGFSKAYIVTCIGAHDAASALTNSFGPNATALTYNGVTYSKANIENGSYALWNFEHLYYITQASGYANSLATVTNGTALQSVADAIADNLFNGTFGTSSTDVGIAGNLLIGYPAMLNRGVTAGSYLY
jgi:hypothetical protein